MVIVPEYGISVPIAPFLPILEKSYNDFKETPAGVRLAVKFKSIYYQNERYRKSLEALMDFYFPIYIPEWE